MRVIPLSEGRNYTIEFVSRENVLILHLLSIDIIAKRGRQFLKIKFLLSFIMMRLPFLPGHVKNGIVILLCIFESIIVVLLVYYSLILIYNFTSKYTYTQL